jgi:hypothetical protein
VKQASDCAWRSRRTKRSSVQRLRGALRKLIRRATSSDAAVAMASDKMGLLFMLEIPLAWRRTWVNRKASDKSVSRPRAHRKGPERSGSVVRGPRLGVERPTVLNGYL